MDPRMQAELSRLLTRFEATLAEVRSANQEAATLEAWRRVQTLGWELSAILPIPVRRDEKDKTA